MMVAVLLASAVGFVGMFLMILIGAFFAQVAMKSTYLPTMAAATAALIMTLGFGLLGTGWSIHLILSSM